VHVLFALRPARRAACSIGGGQSESKTMWSGRRAVAAPALFIAVGRQLNFIEHLLNAAEHSVVLAARR
jgi:hypothetical protein